VAASLEPFERDPLLFEPGRDFRYSNYGYVMLSAAIEAAAGADFLSVVKREVLDPLGMRATLPNHADRAAPRQAAFYDTVTPYSRDGSLVVSPDNDFSSKWASGGFLSSAPDLARLGSAHVAAINSRFLGAETLETLFEPLSGTPPLLGYGLGWISARDLQLRRVHFHFGAGSGATALLAIYPEQRLVFAILCNLGHARYPMARLLGIVEPFLADPLVVPLIALVALGSLATARVLRRRV
jgi:CubicO group peptidase (beta-lactamase class C family)